MPVDLSRLRNFSISSIALTEIFGTGREGHFRIVEGFPSDARILRHSWDRERNAYFVTVQSESFDVVPRGHIIPEQNITIQNLSPHYEALKRAAEIEFGSVGEFIAHATQKAAAIARKAEGVQEDGLADESKSAPGRDRSQRGLESGS